MTEPFDWRKAAIATFPELDLLEDDLGSPYSLWGRLRDAFGNAYDEEPRNEGLIRRIYNFSDECVAQPQKESAEDDLLTCVVVCFYEHIPEHPLARADMPRWWPRDSLEGEPNIFRYHLTDEEFAELKEFMQREAHRYDPSLRAS